MAIFMALLTGADSVFFWLSNLLGIQGIRNKFSHKVRAIRGLMLL